MPGRDPSKPATDLSEFSSEQGDAKLLGVNTEGTPVYYDPVAHVKLDGDGEVEESLPDWTNREELSPDTSVTDVINDVGDTIGWSALSEFGEEHEGHEADDAHTNGN